eukprot:7321340-Pyramimonas_sp.AAC.1
MSAVPDVLDDYWLDDLTANLLDEYVELGGLGASFSPDTEGMGCAQQLDAEVPKRWVKREAHYSFWFCERAADHCTAPSGI